jgi:hypothetical protein
MHAFSGTSTGVPSLVMSPPRIMPLASTASVREACSMVMVVPSGMMMPKKRVLVRKNVRLEAMLIWMSWENDALHLAGVLLLSVSRRLFVRMDPAPWVFASGVGSTFSNGLRAGNWLLRCFAFRG